MNQGQKRSVGISSYQVQHISKRGVLRMIHDHLVIHDDMIN